MVGPDDLAVEDCFDQLNRFGKGARFAQGTKFSLQDPDASVAGPHNSPNGDCDRAGTVFIAF
jgi:hypothetical protein